MPYAYSDLEPYIDTQTMRLHYEEHHGLYIRRLNTALDKYPELRLVSIEELLVNLDSVPEVIRYAVRVNGGGHSNHTIFWQIMKPADQGRSEPTGELRRAMEKAFGSFRQFQWSFAAAATPGFTFDRGWCWLIANPDDSLSIETTRDETSPFEEGKTAVIGLDCWDHAYYLKYHNKRREYIEAWWNVVDWEEVERRYWAAKNA